jgi:hypothetical protein
MTFDELVRDVAKRLNLTSPEAYQRIGERVNERYKKVTSSIGVITSRRKVADYTVNSNNTLYAQLPDITFTGIEKILRITTNPLPNTSKGVIVLKILTYDEIQNGFQAADRLPRAFAVKRMGSTQVTITLDSYVTNQDFNLHVEAYDLTDVLADDAEPFLPEDFHDVLTEGAMADELMKMEKPQLAMAREQKYEDRLGQLRMFIARNAYQDIAQGIDKPSQLWYRPWYTRISQFG